MYLKGNKVAQMQPTHTLSRKSKIVFNLFKSFNHLSTSPCLSCTIVHHIYYHHSITYISNISRTTHWTQTLSYSLFSGCFLTMCWYLCSKSLVSFGYNVFRFQQSIYNILLGLVYYSDHVRDYAYNAFVECIKLCYECIDIFI